MFNLACFRHINIYYIKLWLVIMNLFFLMIKIKVINDNFKF